MQLNVIKRKIIELQIIQSIRHARANRCVQISLLYTYYDKTMRINAILEYESYMTHAIGTRHIGIAHSNAAYRNIYHLRKH